MQSRVAHCPAWGEFWDWWRRGWSDWTHHACQWQTTTTSHELWLCATLLIPVSLIDTIPQTERHKLRAEVGLFKFPMIQVVQTLRWKLADPTPQRPPSPLWLTRVTAQSLPPRETARNLRDYVGATCVPLQNLLLSAIVKTLRACPCRRTTSIGHVPMLNVLLLAELEAWSVCPCRICYLGQNCRHWVRAHAECIAFGRSEGIGHVSMQNVLVLVKLNALGVCLCRIYDS